jgi:RAB protein geranylgeranyltransferase component A
VHGGTYILGEQAQPSTVVLATSEELALSAKAVSITLPSHPRPVTADHLVANPDYLAAKSASEDGIGWTAHAICILPSLPRVLQPETQADVDLDEEEQDKSEDAMIVVFPPEGNQPLVRVLLMGEGTGSCPEGQCKLFI